MVGGACLLLPILNGEMPVKKGRQWLLLPTVLIQEGI